MDSLTLKTLCKKNELIINILMYSKMQSFMNIVKTIIINLVNIFMAGLLYFFSFGFCAVWSDWAHNLLIIWLITLLIDFLVMEIILELLIFSFFMARNKGGWLKRIMNFIINIKNLRNYS
jgi:hypothetical protein